MRKFEYPHINWRRLNRVFKKEHREIIAGVLLVAVLVSSAVFFRGSNVEGATYMFTQSSWSGGVDGVATANHAENQAGWTKFASSSNISAVNGGDDLQLATASSSFSETFTGTTYKDAGATTANWNTSSGQLELLADQGFDLTAKLNGIMNGSNIRSVVRVGDEIYAGGESGKFVKYNPSTDTATDLTSKISGFYSGAVYALAYDPVGNVVYVSGGQGQYGTFFGKYDVAANVGTSLTAKVSPIVGGFGFESMFYEPATRTIYLGTGNGKFLKYDIVGDAATDLTAKISAFWGTAAIYNLALSGQDIYLGGGAGKFAKYNYSTDAATDLTSKISSFWGTSTIQALALDTANSVVYIGGASGKFAKYVIGTDTATNITSKISSFWSTQAVYSLSYNSAEQALYIGGLARYARYVPATDTTTNLSSRINTFFLSSSSAVIYAMLADASGEYLLGSGGKAVRYYTASDSATDLIDSTFSTVLNGGSFPVYSAALDEMGQALYLGAHGGKFLKYDIAQGKVTDLTNKISSFWSTTAIDSMEFDAVNREVYISGGSRVGRYSVAADTATDLSAVMGSSSYTSIAVAGGSIYFGGYNSLLKRYDIAGNSVIDLSAGLVTIWSNGAIMTEVAYDTANNEVYIGGTNGKLAKYSVGSGDFTDLTSKISAFWGSAAGVTVIAYNSGDQSLYFGGSYGKFARYSPATDTATDLTGRLPGWGTASSAIMYSMAFDASGQTLYAGGANSRIAKYDIASGVGTSLYASVSAYIGSSTNLYGLEYYISGSTLYLSGIGGKFAKISGCSSCSAVSLSIDSTSQSIISATLTKADTPGTGSVTYYLSNDAGATWGQVTPGQAYTFQGAGSDLRFKVSLTGNATVQSLSVSYDYYSPSGYLISSPYNAGDPTNVIGGLYWMENAELPASSTVAVAVRTAASSDFSSSNWTELTSASSGCTKDAGAVTCSSDAIPPSLKDGVGDGWLQYKVPLSGFSATPLVSEVRVTYVVNAPPQFNLDYPTAGAGGAAAVQIATSTDPDWGKVYMSYSVRDPDTTFGSNTPGYVAPSFEYDIGLGWAAMTEENLSAEALSNKAVDAATYATYSAVWNAKAQVPGTYTTNGRVRVTVNDGEAANNTTSTVVSGLTIDTKDPVGSLRADSSNDTIALTATDDTLLSYRLSNSADFGSTAFEGGASTTIGNPALAWGFPGGDGPEKIYLELRDAYGNATTTTAVIPATPQNFDLRDISNVRTEEYREFVSWKLYSATTSAEFAKYELYRSTDNANFSLLASVTDQNTNFYTDTNVASSTTYYYKVAVVDAEGDRSSFSTVLSDRPDGQGGTDFTAPVISNVSVAEVQTNWVKITWTTDEISDSKVEYAIAPSTAFGSVESSPALATEHSIVLTGLSPNTTYLFRVKSKDIFNNEGMGDNGGAGHTLTTAGGPGISDVTVVAANDSEATITWNTDRNANSRVVYSTNLGNLKSGTNVLEAGNAAMVGGPPFQHRVTVSGLTGRTIYYFYVKSAAEEGGYESTDTNGGNYFTFSTTNDTKAPVISNVSVPVIAQNAVSIIWQTDELANSQVEYGETSGGLINSTVLDPTNSIYHIVSLSNLTTDHKYYYRVRSSDSGGNVTYSEESSFRTAPEGKTITVAIAVPAPGSDGKSDTDAPVISNVAVTDIGAFEATITFKSSEAGIGFVDFGTDDKYGKTVASSEASASHSLRLFGLRPGTKYYYRVRAEDKKGNFSTGQADSFSTKFVSESLAELTKLEDAGQFQSQLESLIESTLPSLVPPVISDIEIAETQDTSATITWNTNVKTYGSIAFSAKSDFDADKDTYTSEMSDTAEKGREHKVVLTNLEPGAKYNFQIRSFVLPGVIGKSRNRTFATKASKIKPEIVKVMNDGFTAVWRTPVETTSYVEYRNLKTGKTGQMGDDTMSLAHTVEVKNIAPAATYEVRVFGYDKNKTLVEGDTARVTTKQDAVPPKVSDISISNAFVPYRPNQLQTIVSWTTDEPSNSLVQFEEGAGVSEDLQNTAGQEVESVDRHVVVLSSFKPGTVYRIKIISTDDVGNKTETPVRTIITPVASESVFEVIVKNFEDAFGFLKNIGQ